MASQRFVAKRHALVLQVKSLGAIIHLFALGLQEGAATWLIAWCFQGFSFLWRYLELRGECQESMYNLGRALHQLGLTHLAIHYYQKALALPVQNLEVCLMYCRCNAHTDIKCKWTGPPLWQGMPDDQLDLRREIAFNLSLIYQTSGNTEMARQLINTYCIIWKYPWIHQFMSLRSGFSVVLGLCIVIVSICIYARVPWLWEYFVIIKVYWLLSAAKFWLFFLMSWHTKMSVTRWFLLLQGLSQEIIYQIIPFLLDHLLPQCFLPGFLSFI